MAAASSPRVPSIRRRLLTSALLTIVVGALLSAGAAAFAVSRVVEALMASALEETAQALVVLAEHERDVEALAQGQVLSAAPHRELLIWQLRRSDGALVARSHEAPPQPWDVPMAEGYRQTQGLAVFTVAGQTLWLQVAQSLSDLHRAQRSAALQAGLAVIVLSLIAAAIVTWRIQRELRPVAQMARDVESINPGPVKPPLPRSPRVELEPVYAALERLLERLAQKLRSEQAFASHAAHSLRTPLAGLTAQLEVARLNASSNVLPQLDLAMDAARRLNGVVGGLLAMARTAGPIHWHQFAARDIGRIALGRKIEVDVTDLELAPAMVGNLDLLSVAVANLVDNAVRHGASHASIRASIENGMQHIRVIDDGPGIPRGQLASLRDALSRFDERGEIVGAAGLGLTLAGAVARTHGGRVDFECGGPDTGGLCVQLSWPTIAPASAGGAT